MEPRLSLGGGGGPEGLGGGHGSGDLHRSESSIADDRIVGLIAVGVASQVQGPVDVAGLLAGAYSGARRIRHRRRAAVATVVAVGLTVPALVVGSGVLGGGRSPLDAVRRGRTAAQTGHADGADPSSAAGSPSALGPATSEPGGIATLAGPGSASEPDPGGTPPGGTQVEGSTGAVLTRDVAGRYLVGDQAVLQDADIIVAPMRRTTDQATADGAGPTATAVCRALPPASARAAGGRSVGYVQSGDDGDAWQVSTVVRVLPGSSADAELEWLRRSIGFCASDLHLRRSVVDGVPGDDVVLGYQLGYQAEAGGSPWRPGAVLVVGVVRQGRATASVELVVPAAAARDPQSRIQLGVDQARHLLAVADQRLEASGLVGAAQADPLLAS